MGGIENPAWICPPHVPTEMLKSSLVSPSIHGWKPKALPYVCFEGDAENPGLGSRYVPMETLKPQPDFALPMSILLCLLCNVKF